MILHLRLILAFLPLFVVATAVFAQSSGDIRELKLRDWEPRSMMATRSTLLEKAAFPVIDAHNHLGGGKQFLTPQRVGRDPAEMDAAGVRTVVNLDGNWGTHLKETLDALDRAHPGRFVTFALINFDGIDDPDWSKREAQQLEESFKAGAQGLKFHKTLGLYFRYKDGRLVPVDDPKLNPIWDVCAKFHKPVLIHTADPAAFFTPLDRFNERWHELNEHPNWLFYGPQFQKREDLLAQLDRVIGGHPKTTFISTHFGNNAEDLAAVGRNLDRYPNMVVDITTHISELGRQPYTTRRFFLKYQDRILFGTDTTPRRKAYQVYYRFMETDDEYFDSTPSHQRQGFWNIYGIHLPPEVLEKVYVTNAARVLGLDQGTSPAAPKVLHVRRTNDFELTGDGSAVAWARAAWEPLSRRKDGLLPYEARVKVLYSKTGLYVLMSGTDRKLTATITKDFEDLWKEDVFEVFLWPDESQTVYFEYEISPLGQELPILVPNFGQKFLGWRPWHYEGPRRKATSVSGGDKKSGAAISGWTAEVFIPYELLKPLANVPPEAGTRWRANFYRVDYDDGKSTSWDWSRVGPSFHEYQKYGTLVFE